MSQLGVTGLTVFIEINGKQCLAPIMAESADIFMGMLPAFQGSEGGDVRLWTLPPEVIKHVQAARMAILEATSKPKEQHT